MPDFTKDDVFQKGLTFLACFGMEYRNLLILLPENISDEYTHLILGLERFTGRKPLEVSRQFNENYKSLPDFKAISPHRFSSEITELFVAHPWLVDVLIVDERFKELFEILKFTIHSPHHILEKAVAALIYKPARLRDDFSEFAVANAIECTVPELFEFCQHCQHKQTLRFALKIYQKLRWWDSQPTILFFASLMAYRSKYTLTGEGLWEIARTWNGDGQHHAPTHVDHLAPFLAGCFMRFLSRPHWTSVAEMMPDGEFVHCLLKNWETRRYAAKPEEKQQRMLDWFKGILCNGIFLPGVDEDAGAKAASEKRAEALAKYADPKYIEEMKGLFHLQPLGVEAGPTAPESLSTPPYTPEMLPGKNYVEIRLTFATDDNISEDTRTLVDLLDKNGYRVLSTKAPEPPAQTVFAIRRPDDQEESESKRKKVHEQI
jgi:hypothetical protein